MHETTPPAHDDQFRHLTDLKANAMPQMSYNNIPVVRHGYNESAALSCRPSGARKGFRERGYFTFQT